MSLYPRLSIGRVWFSALLCAVAVLAISAAASAQDDDEAPKIDIYTGYQWLAPGGSVPSPLGTFNAPVSQHLNDLRYGGVGDVTFNFSKFVGLSVDYGVSSQNSTTEGALSVGPRFMVRRDGVDAFIHSMVSWNRLTAPGLVANNGIGAVVGAGIDLKATKLISIRLAEVDYEWGHHNYADLVAPQYPDLRRPGLEGVRATAGIVWNFGYPTEVMPSATVTVQPTEVISGEPVTATATPSNFNPKHTLSYSWTSSCGKIEGNNTGARIDTTGAAAGSCTVTVHVTDTKKKKNNEASASANFTVKAQSPPQMSCTANPTSVEVGGTVNLSCTCTSPDNSPVTVGDWTATSGSVNGTGNNATLNTTGASPGTVTVHATCTDQRGLKSEGSADITVQAPPPPTPPPAPQASKLSQCDFPNKAKPWRVDNTCKAILDDVAKNLQQNADNKLVIVGNSAPEEKRKNLAAERAVDAKAYLTGGEAKQGIDPSRIETRTGSAGTPTAEFWVVPAGANFSGEGTQSVDENKVKPIPDHPHAAAHKKMKPKA